MGLGHAHRRGAHAQLLDPLQVFHRLHLQVDRRRTVEARCDRLDLLDDRRALRGQEREAVRLGARRDHGLRELDLVASSRTSAISAGVSVGKLLMATTHGRPY